MLRLNEGMKTKSTIELDQVDSPLERSESLLGTDELNLCEFPLAACGQRAPDCKTLTFEDEIFDEGNQQSVHRKLVIAASDAFGLPTPADSDVLLVLMHLTRLRNRFESPTVHFTRYELVKFLGWNQSGRSYQRLDEAFNRWASVTLFYNRAWWDRDVRSWRSKSFHVLETVDLRGRSDRDDCDSSFTWNPVLFQSFVSHNIRRLDLNTYFALKLPAARQAFRFLDKRFHRSRKLELDLRRFACEHVGLSRNYDNAQLRRKLQGAVEELEQIGFLKPLALDVRYRQVQRGEWQITLIKQATGAAKFDDTTKPPQPLVAKLVERGVHAATAAELTDNFPAAKITEKLALHDWLVSRRDRRVSRNPAGFLAMAIRQDYPLPAKMLRAQLAPSELKSVVTTESKTAARTQRLAADRVRQHRQSTIQFLDRLSAAERAALREQALADHDNPLVVTFKKTQQGPLADRLLREILIHYMLRIQQPQNATTHPANGLGAE